MGNVLEKIHENLRKLETGSRLLSENKETTVKPNCFQDKCINLTF